MKSILTILFLSTLSLLATPTQYIQGNLNVSGTNTSTVPLSDLTGHFSYFTNDIVPGQWTAVTNGFWNLTFQWTSTANGSGNVSDIILYSNAVDGKIMQVENEISPYTGKYETAHFYCDNPGSAYLVTNTISSGGAWEYIAGTTILTVWK